MRAEGTFRKHLFTSSLVISVLLGGTVRAWEPYPSSSTMLLAQRECHPSYEGECVPITSDADCAGGSGNGPAYVRGPVRVVGPDEYGLDRDGDGLGCE
jgi:hypothetical protein